MNDEKERSSFSGSLGFIMAAAGSAVGLGNIWRFPYLAAKDGGGIFLLVYFILALTFGFALLTSEVAIGRKTRQSPLTAYSKLHPKWYIIGIFACLVPTIILPYYCAIGGWVLKYLYTFLTGSGLAAAQDGFFGAYITAQFAPVFWMLVFFGLTFYVVYKGVDKGIEPYSKVLMPILFLLIVIISFFSLTLEHTDAGGATRTGLEGLAIYVIPDFTGMTLQRLLIVIMDAMGQLFFSISVAMGIMVAYGSYARKDINLMNSINQIEFYDTLVAVLAGMMIIPAVYTFMGREGMSGGPGLLFISLPKIFAAMGGVGPFIGIVFFLIVAFAALTSSVSIMEAVVSSLMDRFDVSRSKSCIIVAVYTVIFGLLVCFGYNLLYFEVKLPNGAVAQVLDRMDYLSNNLLMPLVALLTCLLIGWQLSPQTIIEEVEQGGYRFQRRWLYIVMIRFVAPALLFVLLLQSTGILNL